MPSFPLRHVLTAVAAGVLVANTASAPLGAQGAAPRWHFSSPSGAWALFAVLGDAQLGGSGPFPYYRRDASAPRISGSLRHTLSVDPAFEVLHFLPLYVAQPEVRQIASTMRQVASQATRAASVPSAFSRDFATTALLEVLPRSAQRAVLAEVADAVERIAAAPVTLRRARIEAIEQRWQTAFAGPLDAFLRHERLSGGRVLLVASLGAEGRVFTGNPAISDDNVVAVASDAPAPGLEGDEVDDAPLFAVVRELCFPLVTRAMQSLPPGDSRVASASRSSLAAVRCGDRLMTSTLPSLREGYRRHWIRQRNGRVATGPEAFTSLYPSDLLLDAAIQAELNRALESGAPSGAVNRKTGPSRVH